MRLAAIDVGTTSIHIIVAEVRPDGSFDVIDREKEMVRLGAGGLEGRALTAPAMQLALQTLAKFRRLAASHRVDEVRAVATSAVREAPNGGEFLAAVEEQTGIRPRVISGIEEARLIHQAALYGVDVGAGAAVVIDIGGGTTEITLGTRDRIRLARSLKLGAIRLTERFVRTDPLSSAQHRRLVAHVRGRLRPVLSEIRAAGFSEAIVTSGTAISVGMLALGGSRQPDPTDFHHVKITARQIHRVRKQLVSLDLDRRLRLPGIEPRRADLLVAGSVLLDCIVRGIGAEKVTLCDFALREGLVLEYIRKHQRQIARVERYPDIRRRSVMELAERCHYRVEHTGQITRLALSLFDQAQSIHGLPPRAREWLEYSAILHDIGYHISYDRHHRHSYYLIKNGGLRGFEPAEVEAVALMARHHRRAEPQKTHDTMTGLPGPIRKAVRTGAAILRLAESLDRSHSGAIERLELVDRAEELLVRLSAASDAELEIWAAERHVRPLEKALGRPVRIALGDQPHDEHTADAP